MILLKKLKDITLKVN